MSIFKACDVRGVVGAEWDESDAWRIGQALGRAMRLQNETRICLGGVFRRTTPRLKQALTEGLLQAEMRISEVGQQPTPVVYFAARRLACPNVAVVTASHNPGQYNGVKFLLSGRPPDPETMQQLEQTCRDLPVQEAIPRSRAAWCERVDIVAEVALATAYQQWATQQAADMATHAPHTRSGASPCSVAARPLRVVVDAMRGACTHVAPHVLSAAGYNVQSLSQTIDPDFAERSPNPSVDANLQTLASSVIDEHADAGVALDGDGDRVVLVDHTGSIVRPEQLAVLILQHCFQRPTVVYDLKSASILPRAVAAAGGTPVMRPSGYGFIKATMIDTRAEMGVEASGHHFFRVLDGGDDGLFTALLALEIVRRSGATLAELIRSIGWPAITPDLRVPFAGDAEATMEKIATSCCGRISRLDGVRAEYDDGWALIRPSITEPVVTLRFEGRAHSDLRPIARRFLAAVPEIRNRVLEKIA